MKFFGIDISFVKPKNQFKQKSNFTVSGGAPIANYKSDGSKYRNGLKSLGTSYTYDHSAQRRKARASYQDSTDANAIIKSLATDIANTGLRLSSQPDRRILKLSEEQSLDWAADVESRFNLWASDKSACRSEVMNFYQANRLLQLEKQRDGEFFVRLYYSKDSGLINPLQFEPIDPEQIRGNGYTSTAGQFANADGIDRDDRGREISYKIWNSRFVENRFKYVEETVPAKGTKSGKIMMLHGYAPEYAGQGRGISALAASLQDLMLITDLKLTGLQKAINQASITLTVENNMQDPGNPFKDASIPIPDGSGFGVSAKITDESGNETYEDSTVHAYTLPEFQNDIAGSTMVLNNRQGDKIQMLKSGENSESFENFSRPILTSIASSAGVTLERFQKVFTTSFTSARAALLVHWQEVKIEIEEFVSDLHNPIFEMWLDGEIASGRVKAPGWSDPLLRRAWLRCKWIGAAMPNIDPLRTAKGEELYLSMSATTGDQVSLEHNGSDFRTNIEKNKRSFSEMPLLPKDIKQNG